tara:strand:+ start:282 stop:734 length:453 start_codon:yes stop_codon:yes gene_type:complete
MKTENTKEDYIINKDKQNYKYLVVNEEKLKTNLTSMIKQLENVYYDDIEECYFYYGGGKIPVANESGTELECKENLKLIIDFLPIMKSCIKGHSNWSNMIRGQKRVATHLKFYIKVLTDINNLKNKTIRFPKFKSYIVKKYFIPKEVYCR